MKPQHVYSEENSSNDFHTSVTGVKISSDLCVFHGETQPPNGLFYGCGGFFLRILMGGRDDTIVFRIKDYRIENMDWNCKNLNNTTAFFKMIPVLLETFAKHNGALRQDLPITEQRSLDN